jgi:uncharacterized protein YcgI (DUF1989 family)
MTAGRAPLQRMYSGAVFLGCSPNRATAVLRMVATSALVVALSACANQEPPPIDNGFCRIYVRLPDPADAVNMKQRANKIAVLTNEQSADRECRSGDMGPR